MLRSFAAAGLAGLVLVGTASEKVEAAPGNGLIAHRAVYDLELEKATDRSGIDGMYGRMVYEFNGSVCDGYTVSFRFATRITAGDNTRLTDQQTTTYENPSDRTFRFLTRSYVNGAMDKEVRGSARGTGNQIVVDLKSPKERHLKLPQSKFPTEHMLELIDHAEKGNNVYQSRIFDGSENADQSMLTTTVIGAKQEPATTDEEASHAGLFSRDAYWPVSIAYFNGTEKGDETPDYRIAFKLYENGVTRDLLMDYGDFALRGTLASLETLKTPSCGKDLHN
jgi:hypothetical protein